MSLSLTSNDALRGQLAGAVGNLSDVVRQLSRAGLFSSLCLKAFLGFPGAKMCESGGFCEVRGDDDWAARCEPH